MHMPPPVHGAAMMGQYIHDSKLINESFECRYINESSSRTIDEVGGKYFKKVFRFIGHLFFYFEKLYRPVFDALDADNAVIQIMYSVVVLIISFAVIKLMSRSKYLALIFLGRKFSSKQ